MNDDRIKMMFKLMEYDYLTERQHNLIISFEKQFLRYGRLSELQLETLESIFEQAAEKVEWSRQ